MVQTKVVASLQTLQQVVEAELSPLVELARLQITAQLRAAHFKVEMVVLSVVPKAVVVAAAATLVAVVVARMLSLVTPAQQAKLAKQDLLAPLDQRVLLESLLILAPRDKLVEPESLDPRVY